MPPITRPRVYRRLRDEAHELLRPARLSKATLTELSHVLENVVIEHDLPGTVFTGFQESGNWLRALERYERLVEPQARSVAVFASGDLGAMRADDIVKVHLAEDSPLVEEWFIIVLTPRLSAVLLGEDLGLPAPVEADRLFETVWSFDPDVIAHCCRFVRDEVAELDAATADRLDQALIDFPPLREHSPLQDEVVVRIVTALERSRDRQRAAARVEQAAADRLRDLDNTKNAFLSAVSHELRTPLTVVRGMAETLDVMGDRLTPANRAQIERALRLNTERLTGLLDDLLDLDRLMRGTIAAERARFDLLPLLETAITAAGLGQRTRLEAPTSLEVEVDRVQLERIVTNLLHNVTKYAPEGPVAVHADPLPRRGVRLRIRDHGPGIPEDQLEEVFRTFHRGQHDHPRPGTGIGLALVAEFATLHGGRAWAEPRDGPGARLVVELPGPPTT